MAMLIMAAVLFGGIGAWLRHVNRRRAAGKENHRVEGLSAEEIEELGEDNPDYVYTY